MTDHLPLGLYPATVTPFDDTLAIDGVSLETHLRATAATPGVRGIVVNGNAGEILALTNDERRQVVEVARATIARDQILIAGLEARSIPDAVAQGKAAKAAGADALLVLPPFDVRSYRHLVQYERPVVDYFAALDREVGLPFVIFQYPEHAGCAYPLRVLKALCASVNIIGIKAATGSITRYAAIFDALGEEVSVLAAADAPELLGMLLHGSHGALIGISVVGTSVWVDLVDRALAGDAAGVTKVHQERCVPLMAGIYENQVPSGPVRGVARTKAALALLGQIRTWKTRPLGQDVDNVILEQVRACLVQAGLLGGAADRDRIAVTPATASVVAGTGSRSA